MKPLSAAEAQALADFLASPDRPDEALSYHGLQGFFFALACAPKMVQPSEWLPMVLGELNSTYFDGPEARANVERIMRLYNQIVQQTLDGEVALPADCQFREDALANLEQDAPISQWSRGFLRGHGWLEEDWDNFVPESLEEEFGANLLALSLFSHRRLAEAFVGEFKPAEGNAEPPSLEHVTSVVREMFPQALSEYAQLGRTIQQACSDLQAEQHVPRRHQKVGRNEICPCGSGKKYKKCCGVH